MRESLRLGRNAAVLTAASVIAQLANLAFVALAARRLGVDGYGIYATAITFLFFGQMLSHFGLQRVVVRDVAQRNERAMQYLSSAILFSLPIALVVWALLPPVASSLGYHPEFRHLLGLLGAALVGYIVARPAEGVLRAFEQMTVFGLLRVAISVGTAAAGGILLLAGQGLPALMLLQVISVWTEATLLLLAVHRFVTPLRFEPSLTAIRWLAGEGFVLFLMALFKLAIRRADVLLLARFGGSEAVGLYMPGVRIMEQFSFIQLGAMGALFPFMSARWQESPQTLGRVYHHSLRIFALYGFGLAVALTWGAEPLLQLVFGPNYLPGAVALRLLAWGMVAGLLSGPINAVVFISRRRLKQFVLLVGGLALLRIALNLWLVPRWGYLGTAIAALSTSMVSLVLLTGWTRGMFTRPSLLSIAWRPFVAGLGMAGVMALLQPIGFWIALVPASLAYLAVLVATGAIRPGEIDWIRQRLWRRSRESEQ